MARLSDRPEPITAAALVEANLHSESRLVRTAARWPPSTPPVADDVLAQLVEGASRGDPLTKEIGRIGVARVDPAHDVLRHVIGAVAPDRYRSAVTHRRAHARDVRAMTRWWQPDGDSTSTSTPSCHR